MALSRIEDHVVVSDILHIIVKGFAAQSMSTNSCGEEESKKLCGERIIFCTSSHPGVMSELFTV